MIAANNRLLVVVMVVMMAMSGCAALGPDGSAGEEDTNTPSPANDTDEVDSPNTTTADESNQSTDDSQEPSTETNTNTEEETNTDTGTETTTDTEEETNTDTGPATASDSTADLPQSNDSGQGLDRDHDQPVRELVVSTGGEMPAAGVEVTIERESDGAATTKTTGEDGEAVFHVPEGDYTITGVAPDGTTQEAFVILDEDDEVVLGGVPETHSLTVTVVDHTGAPVEGVTVHGLGDDLPGGHGAAMVGGETDANGRVVFEAYEGHEYILTVTVVGPRTGKERVTIDGDETATITIPPPDDSETSTGDSSSP